MNGTFHSTTTNIKQTQLRSLKSFFQSVKKGHKQFQRQVKKDLGLNDVSEKE